MITDYQKKFIDDDEWNYNIYYYIQDRLLDILISSEEFSKMSHSGIIMNKAILAPIKDDYLERCKIHYDKFKDLKKQMNTRIADPSDVRRYFRRWFGQDTEIQDLINKLFKKLERNPKYPKTLSLRLREPE